MKLTTAFFLSILLAGAATVAFGQPGQALIYYDDSGGAPLGCPCENTVEHPYPDGTAFCIFWDNNANGPDPSDVQPELGLGYAQANVNCFSFNGVAEGLGAGYFYPSMGFRVAQRPTAPDTALYYVQVNAGGCCWVTRSFYLAVGPQDWALEAADWTCENQPCTGGGNPPNAPTNCNASDDTRCLAVRVTWDHDGQNVGGFNVLADGQPVASAASIMRETTFRVTTTAVRAYTVRAFNGAGESAASNADDGSTYLLRLVDGPNGDITGQNLANTVHTLQFERPTPDCYSGVELWLLVNGAVHTLLARDSITTQMTFRLPNDPLLNYCRVLVVDSSFDVPGLEFTDTTASVFHLGIPDAVRDPNLLTADRFELAQNYPNPFNPETQIRFSVAYPAMVRIRIYNVMGELVRTLTDAPYAVGVHQVRWDGRNDAGVSVGAGVYLYRMEAGDFVQVKKMLLMK